MQRTAHSFSDAAQSFTAIQETDELVNDRLPGMPLLGFFTGTLVSLAIWGAVFVVAWNV